MREEEGESSSSSNDHGSAAERTEGSSIQTTTREACTDHQIKTKEK